MRVIVIDNYDSFTYNLVQYLGDLGATLQVYRNDRVSVADVEEASPDRIVISPGPGRPENAGITLAVIHRLGSRIPTLGVCLGHQAIGLAFGARIVGAARPVHGRTSFVEHDGTGVFAGLASPFAAARYHSLVIADQTIPDALQVTARAVDDGTIMAVRHRQWPLHGVQFHPESVLTGPGRQVLATFLNGGAA